MPTVLCMGSLLSPRATPPSGAAPERRLVGAGFQVAIAVPECARCAIAVEARPSAPRPVVVLPTSEAEHIRQREHGRTFNVPARVATPLPHRYGYGCRCFRRSVAVLIRRPSRWARRPHVEDASFDN